MGNISTLAKMTHSARELLSQQRNFVQAHRSKVAYLIRDVSADTGLSNSMVSQTLTGRANNVEVIRAAYRRVVGALGGLDPTFENIGIPGVGNQEDLQAFQIGHLKMELSSKEQLFNNRMASIKQLLGRLDADREEYRMAFIELNTYFLMKGNSLPDVLQTDIREVLKRRDTPLQTFLTNLESPGESSDAELAALVAAEMEEFDESPVITGKD